MNEIAEAWRPWRGVAARLLWSYYALQRRAKSEPRGFRPFIGDAAPGLSARAA